MAYAELAGVICLALAALLSLLSVFLYFMKSSLRLHNYGNTHIHGYFKALLLANAVQSFGTVLNFKWAADGGVTSGTFCSAQGGIKQAGNVATALWSFVLALHLFNLLFLRFKSSNAGFWWTIIGGWTLVAFIVVIGPAAIQTAAKGPYFGISGAWCWITSKYPQEQIFLEYFLEYLSAGFCLVLYTSIFLRIRGNLVHEEGKWSLRFLPRGESWQLSLRRDLIDTSMLHAVKQMMWYPIVYTFLIIPITLARLSQFAGAHVPFWATVVTDIIFNLTGFANVLLFASTRKLLPDARELPDFSTARKDVRKSLWKAGGVTPFTIARSDTAEQFNIERLARVESAHSSRRSSLESEKPAQ
ncbi:Git3 domain-containing protein [Mycena venus]|uniref:Git3 domain-containing protein n=1 Tax=Mycena venus TaxID=2733690 RepID=A0A8H7CUG3_9AGAR|nr:Git3 domain-containing protein [Mycena venus]